MALRYFIYGEVSFTSAAKRTAAGRRLDNRASKAGFDPMVWQGLIDAYGTWPAGHADITKDGLPAMRFCYTTLDADTAMNAQEDVASAWDVFADTDSFWAMASVPA